MDNNDKCVKDINCETELVSSPYEIWENKNSC